MNLTDTIKRRSALLFLAASVVPLLSGCFGAVAVGAGAGVLMAADRRPSEIYLSDEATEIRATNRIGEKFGDKVHINVTSYNRTVLITGEVPSEEVKGDVERTIAGLPNVKATVNELQIAGASSFSARGNDSYITSKVKARFIDHNKFPPTVVKVVTESGAVYLLGLVTQAEADAAVEIARTTGGVMKVVRVMEIISADEARRLDSLTKSAPAKSGQAQPAK
ncbi:MAG: BON domain-containing protein [Rhodocyclaceae bacterium]|nr:MAG: BON domain-containing protein [Rhodocyclaceae bacterium]